MLYNEIMTNTRDESRCRFDCVAEAELLSKGMRRAGYHESGWYVAVTNANGEPITVWATTDEMNNAGR